MMSYLDYVLVTAVFSAVLAVIVYANISLQRERLKLTPEERKAFDRQLEQDVFES